MTVTIDSAKDPGLDIPENDEELEVLYSERGGGRALEALARRGTTWR